MENNLLHVHVFDLHVACPTCPVNILTEKTSQWVYSVIFEKIYIFSIIYPMHLEVTNLQFPDLLRKREFTVAIEFPALFSL